MSGTAQIHVRNADGENCEILQRQRLRNGLGNGTRSALQDKKYLRVSLQGTLWHHQGRYIYRRRRDIPQGACQRQEQRRQRKQVPEIAAGQMRTKNIAQE